MCKVHYIQSSLLYHDECIRGSKILESPDDIVVQLPETLLPVDICCSFLLLHRKHMPHSHGPDPEDAILEA
jgi:hypothetical protein